MKKPSLDFNVGTPIQTRTFIKPSRGWPKDAQERSSPVCTQSHLSSPISHLHCLVLLLFQGLEGHGFLVLIHARACCLFNHTQSFLRLHVDDLGDPALHDQEMGIVHIQRHRMKPQPKQVLMPWNIKSSFSGPRVCLAAIMISKQQVLNLILLHIVGVQEVSIPTSNDDLARNDNLVMHLVPQKKKQTGKMLRFYRFLSFLLYVLRCKTQAVVNLATNTQMKGRHWQ